MALDKDVLRDLIVSKLEGKFGKVSSNSEEILKDFAAAISDAVITHIKNDAEVEIGPGDDGLQRDPGTGDYTDAPLTGDEKSLNIT